MLPKRKEFLASTVFAILGVLFLGINQLTVLADSNISFAKSINALTVIGLFLLLLSGVWFVKILFE